MKDKRKINRRKFLKVSALGTASTCAAALMVYSDKFFLSSSSVTIPIDAKKTFAECGTCSNTFFNILNREFGHPNENEERAADRLAGGLMSTQNQCGMLWGSTLAVGAESFRRFKNRDQAITTALKATQSVVRSFTNRAKSVNCRDIVGVNISDKVDIAEFMIKSLPGGFKNMICMNLAEKWAPEAIQSAKAGLTVKSSGLSQKPMNCACEVVKKMGATDKETVTVAGLAGGIGLSGYACGALAAAIWKDAIQWCIKNPGKSGYANPNSKKIFEKFNTVTNNELLCSKISGKNFKSIDEHTECIKNGGCGKLINDIAQA